MTGAIHGRLIDATSRKYAAAGARVDPQYAINAPVVCRRPVNRVEKYVSAMVGRPAAGYCSQGRLAARIDT